MRKLVLDSMWYGDLTADGASVASARDGSHVLLSGERFDVPPQYGGVLQVRISPDGRQFGGQPQDGVRCITYIGAWFSVSNGPIGPNSLIFGRDGVPHVAIVGEHTPTGSLGYWYVADDGRLVPTVEVYGPSPSVPRLYLHTTRFHPGIGDISVGQGDMGGVAAWIGGRLVLVAPGDTEFVRFPDLGGPSADDVGLCWSEQKLNPPRTTFLWLTVDELAAMPDYPSVAAPAPAPPQPPTPEPTPVPQPPNAIEVVERVHDAVNPPRTVEGAFEVTKRVAWELRGSGAGLLLKPSGENIVTWNGRSFAAGRIVYPDGHLFKVLTDIPTTNGPSWQDEGVDRSLIPRWVAPMNPESDVPAPGPTPGPTPGPVPSPGFVAAAAELVAMLFAVMKTVDILQATVEAQEARIAALEQGSGGGAFPSRIALRTHHGTILCAEEDGRVTQRDNAVGTFETFTVEPQ